MFKGELVSVTFILRLPCDATREQILEWISFEVGYNGSCKSDNPLLEHDLNTIVEPVLSVFE